MCKHDNEGRITYRNSSRGDIIIQLRCKECSEIWDYYPQYTIDFL